MFASCRPHQARVTWKTIVTLCVCFCGLLAAAPAQAQGIGTIFAVPVTDLARFVEVNSSPGFDPFGQPLPGNTVRVLDTLSAAQSPFGVEIAVVSVTLTESGEAAQRIYLPLQPDGTVSPLYSLINPGEFFSTDQIVGVGAPAALAVTVLTSDLGDLDPETARFLLVPEDRVISLEAANPEVTFTVVDLQPRQVGDAIILAALVGIDEAAASGLQIPSQELMDQILALNSNVTVQNTFGQSVFQLTTISVL